MRRQAWTYVQSLRLAKAQRGFNLCHEHVAQVMSTGPIGSVLKEGEHHAA